MLEVEFHEPHPGQPVNPDALAFSANNRLAKKIEVNKAMHDGQTPLMKASQAGHLEIVHKLLENPEIFVNSAYSSQFTPENRNTIEAGSTALIFDAYFGHEDVVQELLIHPNIETEHADEHGKTATMIAEREGHETIANLIRQHLSTTQQN